MKQELIDIVEVAFEKGIVPIETSDTEQMFIVDYGIMKKGVDSTFTIVVTEKEGANISRVKPTSACGCTVVKAVSKGNEHRVKVKYDTKRMGQIKKSISIILNTPKGIQTIFFRLTGKVVS